MRLGFVEIVVERKASAAPSGLLFEGAKATARDQWGRSLSRWFGKRIQELGLTGRKLSFHSLRHDFRDALREAEVDPELADYVMGHAGQGMRTVYGARPALRRLKAAIAAVSYDEVRLPA